MSAYCKDCKYRAVSNLPYDSFFCTHFGATCENLGCDEGEPKAKTNADRFRAKSDEELAKTLSGEEIYPWCAKPCEYDNCTDCVLAWLKQEAET